MEEKEKEKTFLGVSPTESDFRLLIADRSLTKMSSEERLNSLKEMFMVAAKNHNDEAARKLMDLIFDEYQEEEKKIAEQTDRHYGNASERAFSGFCVYLRSVCWDLPDKQVQKNFSAGICLCTKWEPTLLKTKLEIVKLWMRQWQKCYHEENADSVAIFKFLIAAYIGKPEDGAETQDRYVSKEEKEEILKFFREYTDYRFTPEIAEKWLKQPNVPEEIRKILILARARNGGMPLTERDIKNAELLKSLDTKNRSEAALEFHKRFCGELAEIDAKIRQLLKELEEISLGEAEKIEFVYSGLSNVLLHVRFRKDRLPYHSYSWNFRISQLGQDIHKLFLKYRTGRRLEVDFIFWEGEYTQGNYHDIVYLG